MSKKNIHITPRQEGWAVVKEGNSRASFVFETQKEAINHGRTIARENTSELLIHGRDNKIRQKDSYGNDTYPPKG